MVELDWPGGVQPSDSTETPALSAEVGAAHLGWVSADTQGSADSITFDLSGSVPTAKAAALVP